MVNFYYKDFMIGVIDMKMDSGKSFRLLKMYEWLNRGDVINKKEFAEMFGISENQCNVILKICVHISQKMLMTATHI